MPTYFFTVNNGTTTLQSDGVELPDTPSALMEATRSTGEILRELDHAIEAGAELRMDAFDEARRPIFSLRVLAELHR